MSAKLLKWIYCWILEYYLIHQHCFFLTWPRIGLQYNFLKAFLKLYVLQTNKRIVNLSTKRYRFSYIQYVGGEGEHGRERRKKKNPRSFCLAVQWSVLISSWYFQSKSGKRKKKMVWGNLGDSGARVTKFRGIACLKVFQTGFSLSLHLEFLKLFKP